MLSLKNIVKDYPSGNSKITALKGVSVEFRKSEFVSILGPSGCGKTTLLNIIGGLDQYTSGDLVINGKSTKDFRDSDWDSYRNHSIGFVFQSYNLIPHQTVLSNVELALTLSGVPKAERRRRAREALEQVGLGDQLHKKPNQMSGGQMQRVAIARALVNNPDILLADEPTGALDTETSVQIMEILKEISKDRLIIMVTHNPDLAESYSTRIIRLLDGQIVDDSNPYNANVVEPIKRPEKPKAKKTSMSFVTALSLSLNNLMTKKTRTFMTSFAGSIGIIGIALILSLSNGVQLYINRVEEETLSSYPIAIEENVVNVSDLLSSMMGQQKDTEDHEEDRIYSNDVMGQMLNTMMSELSTNNLEDFKLFIESEESGLAPLVSDIQYGYSTQLNIYKSDTSDGIFQVNPSSVFDRLGMSAMTDTMSSGMTGMGGMGGMDVWEELIGNQELLSSQYDVIAGRMPEQYNEVVVIVDKDNEISDYTLYALGLKDPEELDQMREDIQQQKEFTPQPSDYSYDEILSQSFKLLLNTDYYQLSDGVWVDLSEDEEYMKQVIEDALEVKVVGILRPAEGSSVNTTSGAVGYTSQLMEYLIEQVNDSEIVQAQKADPQTDVFTGKPFVTQDAEGQEQQPAFDITSLSPEEQAYFAGLSAEEQEALISQYTQNAVSQSTYEDNLAILGVADLDSPSSINIYPKDFEAKEEIAAIISDYNSQVEEENVIQYTDYVGLMMSSVTTIINAISYILIAFVSISLVVSSIMIGIITYISVLERTKEIGILRSIGASKRDISRVFNAETLIVGFTSGAIGIGVTLLLIIPINMIIENITGIAGIAALPWLAGIILVLISMLLTFIAGLIPSRIAAKKDPVIALRTE